MCNEMFNQQLLIAGELQYKNKNNVENNFSNIFI